MKDNIISELLKGDNIVLLCHENPDGDAIGSTLALYHALRKIGKDVDIVISDPPLRFSFVEGYQDIKSCSSKKYNIGIVLDTANKERVNNPNDILCNIDKLIVIDHHTSNTGYGNMNYVLNSPACCQIVYDLIKMMNIEIDSLIGIPLVMGIITDTGGFANRDVTAETFIVMSVLSKIVNISSVYKKVLGTITKSAFELKKIAMDHLEFYKDGKIAFSYITYEEIEKVGARRDECSILVNIGREIEGVEVSIFVRVYEDSLRVSLRSTNIDVNSIASTFGGGGHINAAGITTMMKFEDLKSKLIEKAGSKIDEWNISNK